MMITKLGVGAVAAGMLTIPGAAGPPSPIPPPSERPRAPPTTAHSRNRSVSGPCATAGRVCDAPSLGQSTRPRGRPLRRHRGPQPRWVSARGPAGGHSDVAASSCVRWARPRGPAGGHYDGTCPPQPRWVPARGPAGGHSEYVGTSTTQSSTPPIATATGATGAPSWGFDWESAGIGAAGIIGAMALALAAIGGLRGRRVVGPRTP